MPDTLNGKTNDSLIVGQTNHGLEIRGTILKITRHLAVFEIYNAANVLRLSEVLTDFRIIIQGRTLYSGRAVLSSLIDTGPTIVCEATLEDSWADIDFFSTEGWANRLSEDFSKYLTASQKLFKILPEFKIAVADLQVLLLDLRHWLEQVELGVRSQPAGDRGQIEKETIFKLQAPIVATALHVLENFDRVAQSVAPEDRPAHMSYTKRQIHPLVLCAPFIHRTFYKPLGYAGDYEMVNMMVRDPYEGGSIFAKILNHIFLSTPPVEAHRERLGYLTQLLQETALRGLRLKRPARIFNLGCGPAREIQDFVSHQELSRDTQFTLLDFSDESLAHASSVLGELVKRHGRATHIQLVKKPVQQFIKDAAKAQNGAAQYDFVYCAGLFDYVSDAVCKRLMNLLYDSLAPGGLLVATQVAGANPSRNWMEYVLDWHLIYRNEREFATLQPAAAGPDQVIVRSIGAGVNMALEVRKPEHG